MNPARRRITIGITSAAIILIASAVFFKLHQSPDSTERALLSRLPNEPGAVLRIDFATLRRAGLLNARTAPLEPEYKAFLHGTGFDYRRDLDFVIASFSATGNYFIARGRFDWGKLRTYAEQSGGSCYDQLCRAPGSTPERRISFLPIDSRTIALAVSTDDLAAAKLTKQTQTISAAIPNSPVWMSVSGAWLASPAVLPEGIRVTLSGLLNTDRVLITAGPGTNGIVARLEANCRTLESARILESQLRSNAALLKEASRQNKAIENDSLATLLGSGSFGRDEKKVTAAWRIDPALIEGLTRGI